ncbi:hypothetical protein PF005_g16641 [Phytophthora fragariae]|uniref:Uncharacterized protein n=1 Tax=Phytophthora fragariae TaxID=53985 RepID=A0A6A3JMW2_9STRA|nr:hypothetical protein PF003_g37034 [Phytophthora fragariae]KAE8931989.1 hypothetical protein PF009_g17968 [Phytophthora fragariae]KAE8993504.1 hypothetical protein PF011_g17120 [Phytophthora fragariae]KAE9092622.1 hypothetical protein PF007_g18416 [Phytophthora fragariae]KAE9096663.1 hypothetical protein PF010_g16260 [Phytophthora fragariae]
MDPTAADGDGGRRREAAGGDEGGAISGSEVAADAAAAPEVGAVAMGGTQTPEPTNARAPSGAWAAQATVGTNCKPQSCRLDTFGVGLGCPQSNLPARTQGAKHDGR